MKTSPLLLVLLCACASSTPVVQEATLEPEAVPVEVVLAPVSHDGPLRADPAIYDCGLIPDQQHCEFDIRLTQVSDGVVEIDEVTQNASPYARLGIVEHRTGFSRDLPYQMDSGETLRVLFAYRRADPTEEVGGSVFVNYRSGGDSYTLEVPVAADAP